MRKVLYFCGMILLSLDIYAQQTIPNPANGREVDYCSYLKKYLELDFPTTSLPPTQGWIKIDTLSDEFEDTLIDFDKWKVLDEYYHTGNDQTGYLKENVCIEDGYLAIFLSYNPSGIECQNNSADPKIFNYFTGKVVSNNRIQYGYLETKCYFPQNCRYRPGFWTYYQRFSQPLYDEIDVFEMYKDLQYGNRQFLQNCYHNINYPNTSKCYQRLTFSTPFSGQEATFGVEILPHEIVFYVNGHVTSHLRYNNELANSWNTFTCTDVDEMIPMVSILEMMATIDGLQGGAFPLPYDSCKFDYFRCYKLSRGSVDNYHPTVFIPSEESAKVYPHVILGGTGCTAQINTSTAIWAEQDIILDKGFELSAGTLFSARVISVPDPANSPLYTRTNSNK